MVVIDNTARSLLDKATAFLSRSDNRFHADRLSELPNKPGVYIFRRKKGGRADYVGRSGKPGRTLKTRVYEHYHHFKDKAKASGQPLQKWLVEVGKVRAGGYETVSRAAIDYLRRSYYVQCIPITDAKERAIFEHFLIAVLKPQANLKKDYEH